MPEKNRYTLIEQSELQIGTVLGPTLFLLYINDISADILSQLRPFADDCLIYKPIYSNEDHERLQRDPYPMGLYLADGV